MGHVERQELHRSPTSSSHRLVRWSGWRCRCHRFSSSAAGAIDSIDRLQEQAGDDGASCGRFSRGRQLHLQLDFGSMPPPSTGSTDPSCHHATQTEVRTGAGAAGVASTVSVDAEVGAAGGLCDGSLGSDGEQQSQRPWQRSQVCRSSR